MKWQAIPKTIDLGASLQAATYRHAEAKILFEHSLDMHDTEITEIAQSAIKQADAEIMAIYFLLRRLKRKFPNGTFVEFSRRT